jgi:2-methylcitrate dehydratase PrpD
MTAIETLASHIARSRATTLPREAIHHAKRAVVDWYASVLPGAIEEPATLLERAYADDLDRGPARLVLGRDAGTRTAALINGTAAHTVEVDDIYKHAIYHPGAPTIAAALAVAQETGRSGRDLLHAIVVGYDVSTRIGAALGRAHYRYWHNTGTVGVFGAAAATAVLYALDETRSAHALATAATFAAGLQQAFRMDSMSKPLHAGRAAEAGVAAAQMARAGVTGSLDVLDGAAGMGRAMSDAPDWDAHLASLGQEFSVCEMTFKNHACCGHTFAPIDGVLALRQAMNLEADDIARIEVATYGPALEVAGNPAPRTAAEARFSIPFVVATACLFGKVRLAAFTPERLANPRLRSLMARIELKVDPELDALFPGRRSARVRIHSRDGRLGEHLQPNRRGDPEDPLTDAELADKFLELARPVIGTSAADHLLARIWKMDESPGVPAI